MNSPIKYMSFLFALIMFVSIAKASSVMPECGSEHPTPHFVCISKPEYNLLRFMDVDDDDGLVACDMQTIKNFGQDKEGCERAATERNSRL